MKQKNTAKGRAAKNSRRHAAVSAEDLDRVEFHRNAVALMPEPDDRRPGVAIMIAAEKYQGFDERSCSCLIARSKTCPHLLKLADVYKALEQKLSPKGIDEDFRSSLWYQLAVFITDDHHEMPGEVSLHAIDHEGHPSIRVIDGNGNVIIDYADGPMQRSRLAERCSAPPGDADRANRSRVLDQLEMMTLTENERLMLDRGYKTRGMAFRKSFWYKLAYHCYREHGRDGCFFHPAIEETSGDFFVTCRNGTEQTIFRTRLARNRVKRFLKTFEKHLSNPHGLTVHPIPLDTIFDIRLTADMNLEIQARFRIAQKKGEFKLLDGIDFKRFQYDDLVYIPELNILADMVEPAIQSRLLKNGAKHIIEKSRVPAFL